MWPYKNGVNSASRETWKEALSSSISTEPSFDVNSKEEIVNVNKTCR